VNNRDKQLLADRQHRATEQYLQRAKRYLADFTTETRSEERFQNILGIADKLEHLSLSSDQWERYWNIVAVAQQKLAELVPTVRVSTAEYSEPELSGRELGAGAII
tara:strand:+ start:1485 stop:1802 length:318 start_codon:yes stop_codon:yes gene_type:complete